ncbi:MAG: ester cyclase [Pseudomonadota bacterium]
MTTRKRGQYGADSDLVDYILGITFEIWEQGQVELINEYYSDDCQIYALEATTIGAAAVIEGTRATLTAFPDRLLLAENVVWSGDRERGFYSSHRLTSPMTNRGDTLFGPATGKTVRIMNIADCVVEEGVITGEWLVRDNLALIQQLGFDEKASAQTMATQMTETHIDWLGAEATSLLQGAASAAAVGAHCSASQLDFVQRWLTDVWTSSTNDGGDHYAPYATMYRAPTRYVAGREEIVAHYHDWKSAAVRTAAAVDHVIAQPMGHDGTDFAVRWRAAFEPVVGNRPVYILGVSHLRCSNGRIMAEWTVFDELAVSAQGLLTG